MAYRSDRQIVEALVPLKLLHSIVVYGADLSDPKNVEVLGWLQEATEEEYGTLPRDKWQQIARRVVRVDEKIIAPFWKAEAAVSKYGLCVYYVLEQLRDQGYFFVADDSRLEQVVGSILHPDGSIVEAANIAAVDQSARKQARRMFEALQREGLYQQAVWVP